MKHSPAVTLCFILAVVLMAPLSAAHACTVCHSKNPKMVRMHEALEYKDCFVCHGPSAKKSAEDPKKRMASDQLCIRCHSREQR